MDTYLEQVKQAYGDILSKLVTVAVSPKPTYSIEGQSVSHGEYLRMLIDSAKLILEMWNSLAPYQIVSGTV
jgi:hypothetical protein